MVTADHGASCASSASPYINDCHFDAVCQLLSHIYGHLDPPVAQPAGRVLAFDQNEFAGDAYRVSMANKGYVYVLHSCETTVCRVHVAFHGCRQNADTVGMAFVREAGYNRWADNNRIIVLYRQSIARYGFGGRPVSFVFNPNACWDWWGYTGPVYHTRRGPLIEAVQAMLARLAERRSR